MANTPETRRPVQIFYSSAREDVALLIELDRHLTVLKRSGLLQTWSERDILAGAAWEYEVESHLNGADIILLLVSPDFLASDYWSEQANRALARANRGVARVIPIILRPVVWQDTLFGMLQVLPKNGRPVTEWKDRSQAFAEIAREIREVANNLQAELAKQTDWLAEGNRLLDARQYQEALLAFEQALLNEPNNAIVHMRRGDALYALKRLDGAVASYEQAIRLAPANPFAYIGRGRVLTDLGRLTEALRNYQQAIVLDPNNATAYSWLGITFSRLKRYDDALAAYQKARQLDPNNALISLRLAETLKSLERYEEALAIYNRLLKTSPDDITTEIEIRRGDLLLELRQDQPALEAYTHAARLDPRSVRAHLGMGEALLRLNRDEEALSEFDTAIIFEPNNSRANANKATILRRLGQTDEALDATIQAISVGSNIAEQLNVSEEATEIQVSRARVELVQQFLMAAGFTLETLAQKSGFLARPQISPLRKYFHNGLYVRVLLDNTLDQSTVQAIFQNAKKLGVDHALVIINRHPDFSGSAEISILRWEQGWRHFVVLTIDEAVILENIATHKEQREFQHYLGKNLGSGFDPYSMVDPITDVSSFFGRQHLTEDLSEHLRQGQRLGLFGIQKMGKSSVLRQIQRRIEFPVAYVYLRTNDTLDRIYREILGDWQLNGRVKYPRAFQWTVPEFPPGPITPSLFDGAAKSLLNYLNTLTASPMLGIFLDEIEHIVPAEQDEQLLKLYVDLMDSLRGLHLETQSLPLLVAGVHPGVARYNYFWGQEKNPMYQIILEQFLSPLNREDCSDMILSLGQKINLEYDKYALDYILEMSGSHPFLARKLCSLAYRKRRHERSVSVDMVSAAVQEFVSNPEFNSHLDERGLWGELCQPNLWKAEVSAANHELLRRLAASPEDLSEDELCAGLERSVALEALYALKERSLITSPDKSGYYHITFGLLRNWIRFRQLGLALD